MSLSFADLKIVYGAVFESVLSQVVCPGKKILPGHLPRQKLLTGTFAAANRFAAVTTGTFTEATNCLPRQMSR